jgi:hypothetical protein
MSWTVTTIILLVACFIGAFTLCEWFVKRRRDGRDNDRDSLV